MQKIEYLPGLFLSRSIKKVYEQAKKITKQGNSPILIVGEQGTGKELLARSIHYCCSALHTPFLSFSCINSSYEHFKKKLDHYLSILANNKASSLKTNKNQTNDGTIFFRAVGGLEPQNYSKTLNLLKETWHESRCSSSGNTPNLRLIFSHNQNAGKSSKHNMLLRGNFYKTFNPNTLAIMPLRDRKEDIYPLASFFVDQFSKEYSKDIGGIHSEALHLLQAYAWPGNVSELKNVMENAVLLSQSPLIIKEDIRFNISKKFIALESFFAQGDFFRLDELERIYILTIAKRMKNNKSKAAKVLGISRNTLQKRLTSFAASTQKKKTSKKTMQPPLPF